ncbi:hypothetical protein SAMN05216404_1178 [Nitrosospira multiformis]|uniref:Uncharacterized protein n=1 Tax=Nitrosospira multiformis TaxID=1231 RepID=A0A1H8NM61_9PROT|nr:hypothetical protein [Nitrosospira multiformis]SEO30695.1 hypothetical protein SAMN05216404_1178 [Nitrosospira multiformis]
MVVSGLTPLVILILGILINRTLERNKVALSKEQEWQNWWAKKLLGISHDFNVAVSECLANIFALGQIAHEKLPGWEVEHEQKEISLRDKIRLIQFLDWEMQNYLQFAPTKGKEVKAKQEELIRLVASLLRTRQSNFEEIKSVQFEFNELLRLAHAEILQISPNKALQRTSR